MRASDEAGRVPSIAEVARARRGRERRRLFLGGGCLVVGALLVGLGAAGALSAASVRTQLIAAGAAVLVGVLVLAWRAALDEGERAVVAVGTAVAIASLLAYRGLAPAADVPVHDPALLVTGITYLGGLAVTLAAALAASSLPSPGQRPARSVEPVAWRRTSDEGDSPAAAADGGETAADLVGFDEDR